MATIRRVHHSSIANLFVRSLLADVGEMHGGFTKEHWQATLDFFGNRCAYTGKALAPADIDRDHAIPLNRASGGLHRFGNLLPACRQANNEKGSLTYVEFLRSTPGRFASLGHLTTEDRETAIARIESFMEETGYRQVTSSAVLSPEYLEEKYQQVKELCALIRAEVQSMAPPELMSSMLDSEKDEEEEVDNEETGREEDLTDRLPTAYRELLAAHKKHRIGRLAQAIFAQLFADGRVAPFVQRLQEKQYSAQQLGLYVPVLATERLIIAGQPRYYTEPCVLDGIAYYLGSQWNNGRRDMLEDWLVDEVFRAEAGIADTSEALMPVAALSATATQLDSMIGSTVQAAVQAIWNQVKETENKELGHIRIGQGIQQVFHILDEEPVALAAVQRVLTDGTRLGMTRELQVLRPFDANSDLDALRKDSKGYVRYYATPLARTGYLLCKEWNANHITEWTRIFKAAGLL
ncbi:HNH endonuclease [Hymenobacter jeollabukensis]|uniref:HNH endonuclease n=1 Tax=Hymenobacter jeollabukensis TaxID=2025313 RepID=A0A5R8WJV6_9BACT|nr:HNH endonuclease [Hymenobacter jeollabukensis]TLM88970.1 HNH endonuclease [Hymenobacter jeollabukensis]